jgi:hypothetical protein
MVVADGAQWRIDDHYCTMRRNLPKTSSVLILATLESINAKSRTRKAE